MTDKRSQIEERKGQDAWGAENSCELASDGNRLGEADRLGKADGLGEASRLAESEKAQAICAILTEAAGRGLLAAAADNGKPDMDMVDGFAAGVIDGLTDGPALTGRDTILDVARALGLRKLFFGTGDCIALSFVIVVLVGGILLLRMAVDEVFLVGGTFFLSPLLYALLHLMVLWKEWMTGTYEMKMVCRYNLRQITTLRMLVFGAASSLGNGALMAALWSLMGRTLPLLKLLGLSFSALFLFAVLLLAAQLATRCMALLLAVPVCWTAAGLLALQFGEQILHILLAVPTAAPVAAAALTIVLFGAELRRYFYKKEEGGFQYA